jgi:uncharacterized membrane protein YhiD involved in acid resistance
VAVLGIVCGAGIWPVALVGVVLTLVVLVLGRPLEKYLHRRFPSLDGTSARSGTLRVEEAPQFAAGNDRRVSG